MAGVVDYPFCNLIPLRSILCVPNVVQECCPGRYMRLYTRARTSCSFNIKAPVIVCSLEVTFLGWFDIGISFQRSWISALGVNWDESATNLQGRRDFMLDGGEVRSHVIVPSLHTPIRVALHTYQEPWPCKPNGPSKPSKGCTVGNRNPSFAIDGPLSLV